MRVNVNTSGRLEIDNNMEDTDFLGHHLDEPHGLDFELDDDLDDDLDDLDDLLDEFNIKQNHDGTIDTGIQYLSIDTFRVVVHKRVLDTMDQLWEKYKSLEYGLYLKGFFDPSQNIFYIEGDSDDDIFIPRQEVTSATIKFLEGRPAPEFNTAIHRHPEGVTSFSGTDETSINTNFECSLLYMKSKGIFLANMNIFTDMPGVAISFKTKNVKIYHPESERLNKEATKIVHKTATLKTPPKLTGKTPDSLLDKRRQIVKSQLSKQSTLKL